MAFFIRMKTMRKTYVSSILFIIITACLSTAQAGNDADDMPSQRHDHDHGSIQTDAGDTPTADQSLFWESSVLNSEPAISGQHDGFNHSVQIVPEYRLPSSLAPVAKSLPSISSIQNDSSEHNYVCPMHPQIVRGHEGSCPICGMDLVAHEGHEGHSQQTDNPQVFLSAGVIQNMGVRVASAQNRHLDKHIITQGQVSADEDRVVNIHPRTPGWVQKLYPLTEGDRVERKDTLLDFYSPFINKIQLKYIAAMEEFDALSYNPEMTTEVNAKVDSIRNSLRLLNVMDMDINRIKNSRKVQNTIQLIAPQSGVITDLNIREGTYIEPYQAMFTIVDLSRVWVMIDIYEHQAASVRKGQKVTITTPAIPNRSWEAVIDYIYPDVNPTTRTLRARITIDNPDEALLLNMYVAVDISASKGDDIALTVPREAVILTGNREVVIKSLGNGHFQPVAVTSGMRDENYVQILSGIGQDDEIVVSGQFMIDSESSLQASFLRLAK